MIYILDFVFAFIIWSTGYAGVSSCPTLVKLYLSKRNSPLGWVFVFLTLVCSAGVILVVASAVYGFYQLLDIRTGRHPGGVAVGCFTSLVFMTWLNYRKPK